MRFVTILQVLPGRRWRCGYDFHNEADTSPDGPQCSHQEELQGLRGRVPDGGHRRPLPAQGPSAQSKAGCLLWQVALRGPWTANGHGSQATTGPCASAPSHHGWERLDAELREPRATSPHSTAPCAPLPCRAGTDWDMAAAAFPGQLQETPALCSAPFSDPVVLTLPGCDEGLSLRLRLGGFGLQPSSGDHFRKALNSALQ